METTTVGVRLRREVWDRYAAEAQALGVSMGTYLRRRLEEQDSVVLSLNALRDAIEHGAATSAPQAATCRPSSRAPSSSCSISSRPSPVRRTRGCSTLR